MKIDTKLLLNRPEITIDNNKAEEYFKDKTVLVTGASGSIGSELVRQLLAFNPSKIVLFCRNENNLFFLEKELKENFNANNIVIREGSICDSERINAIFQETKPHIVYHAAANKHVPLSESNVSETIYNNVFGTQTIIKAAIKNNCQNFVMISTDKAVNPSSIMGASKRLAELLVKYVSQNFVISTKFSIVRFGNVLGSSGSVVPIFQSQIESGGPIKITHKDMTRFFMTIPEASRLVIQAGMFDTNGSTYMLDMGEQVKILDLAEKMIRLNNLEPYKDIEITFTGIRPGEKIAEELSYTQEVTSKTQHDKIILLNDKVCTIYTFNNINKLLSLAADTDPLVLRSKIVEIIPEATVIK